MSRQRRGLAGRVAYAEHHHSRPDHRFKANPGCVDISRNQSNRSVGDQGVKVAWLRVMFTPLFTLVVFHTAVNKGLHTAGYTRVLVNASIESFHS